MKTILQTKIEKLNVTENINQTLIKYQL